MKRTSLSTILLAAAAIGCDDATGPVVTTSDLVGTWNASSYVVTNAANAEQSADLIEMGMSMTLTFTETTLSGTIGFPGGEGQESFTGTYSLSANQISFTDLVEGDEVSADGNEIFAFTLDGNTLSLSFTDTFSFDDESDEVAVTAVMTLIRA